MTAKKSGSKSAAATPRVQPEPDQLIPPTVVDAMETPVPIPDEIPDPANTPTPIAPIAPPVTGLAASSDQDPNQNPTMTGSTQPAPETRWRLAVDLIAPGDFEIPCESEAHALSKVDTMIRSGYVLHSDQNRTKLYPLAQIKSFTIYLKQGA